MVARLDRDAARLADEVVAFEMGAGKKCALVVGDANLLHSIKQTEMAMRGHRLPAPRRLLR